MRRDYQVILEFIPSGSKILDIGCSDGELINLLSQKGVSCQGVEIDQEKVVKCLEKGLDVIQGDISHIVDNFPHNQFDFCILTQTIQTVQKPDILLNELKKIGKNIIVSFSNSAHIGKISKFLFSGSFNSLLKKSTNDQWFDTYNIHPCSIKDFQILALSLNLKIFSTYDLDSLKKYKDSKIPSNLFCKDVLFHLVNEQ